MLSTTTSSDTIQVTFERSPAGAATWSTIAVDSGAPFSASFDTSLLADGLYDLSAIASDGSSHRERRTCARRGSTTPCRPDRSRRPSAGAASLETSVTLAATAADTGSGIATVKFRRRRRAGGVGLLLAVDARLGHRPRCHPELRSARSSPTPPATRARRPVRWSPSTPPRRADARLPGSPLSGTASCRPHRPDTDTARVNLRSAPRAAAHGRRSRPTRARLTAAAFDTARSATASATSGRSPTTSRQRLPPRLRPGGSTTRRPRSLGHPGDGSTIGECGLDRRYRERGALGRHRRDVGRRRDRRSRPSPARPRRSPPGRSPTDRTPSPARSSTPPARPRRFTTHFTIVSGPPPADWPYVEMNALPRASTTTLHLDRGDATPHHGCRHVTGPDRPPGPAHRPEPRRLDYRRLRHRRARLRRHQLLVADRNPGSLLLAAARARPGEPTTESNAVPATFQTAAWRPVAARAGLCHSCPPAVPTATSSGRTASHILTTHLSEFTLFHDRFPPPPPAGFVGVVAADGLTLPLGAGRRRDRGGRTRTAALRRWRARRRAFDPTQFETKLGAILAGDPRTFSFTDTDAAGNLSAHDHRAACAAARSPDTASPTRPRRSPLPASRPGRSRTCSRARRLRHRPRAGGRRGAAARIGGRPHRLCRVGSLGGSVPDPRSRAVDLPADSAAARSRPRSSPPNPPRRASCSSTHAGGGSPLGAGRCAPGSTTRACASRPPRATC